MTKRYREVIEAVELDDDVPISFRWRGRSYRVVRVIGHWREDPGWWRRGAGEPIRIEQADLWRVEARNGAPERHGVYELVRRAMEWHLDRIWD